MMAAQVMAMAHRNSVCGMYANPKPVSASGGVLLNKPATTGLLRFGQMRSKREIGCVARGEKEEVGTNKVEPYAECISTRTSELKAGSLWKIFSPTADGDSKEERKDKKSSSQVKELVQVHKAGVYLSVLLFALCFALKQAGVDVPTMLRKVHEKREKYCTFLPGYAAQDVVLLIEMLPTVTLTPIFTGAVSHGAPRMGCGMRDYHTSEFRHGASRMAWTSQVSLKKASPSWHLVSKPVASLSCTAALGTTCQAEQQTMQNKSAVVSKAPIECKI